MSRQFEALSIEQSDWNINDGRQSFSVLSIPSLAGIESLGTVFSEFDSTPDRVFLLPPFEADPDSAKEVIREAAEKITPTYLFPCLDPVVYPTEEHSFSYLLEPKKRIEDIHGVLVEQIKKRRIFSHALELYGFKSHYVSSDTMDKLSDVYLGSLALIQHFDRGKRKIIATIELADKDEKAA